MVPFYYPFSFDTFDTSLISVSEKLLCGGTEISLVKHIEHYKKKGSKKALGRKPFLSFS